MIEDTIDDLNKLLEFELGALDTYKQNLSSTKEKSFSKVLEEIAIVTVSASSRFKTPSKN